MPFSRDTLVELSMTLTHLSGAKSLRDPLLSQLLGEWVASSSLANARWYEATKVAQLPLIRNKQLEAVKRYASVLFPAPALIGSLMDLNVPKGGLRHVSEFIACRGGGCLYRRNGPLIPRPIPSHDRFTDPWKEWVKSLALDRPVSVTDPPTSGPSWPLQPCTRYIQSRTPLVDTIDWNRLLTFLLRGDAYPCGSGSWNCLSIGLLNHSARARTPAYLWVIRIAVCEDKDMAALVTIWSNKPRGIRPFRFAFVFVVDFRRENFIFRRCYRRSKN